VIEGLAVDKDVGGHDLARGITHSRTADGNDVFFQKITGLTSRAVTEIGEELVEAAHGKTQKGGEVFCEPVSAQSASQYVGTKKPRVMNSRL
jgi:hypothetical protein